MIASLEAVLAGGGALQVKEMAQLAEAYYQSGNLSAAEDYYDALAEETSFSSQALYRSAQIRLKQGEKRTALKLLRQLSETDIKDPWAELARDLLIQLKG